MKKTNIFIIDNGQKYEYRVLEFVETNASLETMRELIRSINQKSIYPLTIVAAIKDMEWLGQPASGYTCRAVSVTHFMGGLAHPYKGIDPETGFFLNDWPENILHLFSQISGNDEL